MTHTETDTTQRSLHREVAGTIGLLADQEDFTAMRRYRSFAFDDHHAYLHQIETLLRTRALEGRHTAVALFDPEEYAVYCARSGIEPDTPASRTRFTAELAATGTTVTYQGQPLTDLVPTLVSAALRQATWEYASLVLATIGTCATCGEDIGWASYARACDLVVRVLDRAGRGSHHLVCSAATSADHLLSALDVAYDEEGRGSLDETAVREFATVLATGIATGAAGGLVVRTTSADGDAAGYADEDTSGHAEEGTSGYTDESADEKANGEGRETRHGGTYRDKVYGWRLNGWNLQPLTAAEVFDAYCTDVDSGDIVAPESGVDYGPPPDLGQDEPPAGHTH